MKEPPPDNIRKIRLFNGDGYDSDELTAIKYRKAPPVPPRCKLTRGVPMTKPKIQNVKMTNATPKTKTTLKTSTSMAGLAAIDDFIEQNKREKNLNKSTSGESFDSENSNNFTHVVRHFSGDSGVILESWKNLETRSIIVFIGTCLVITTRSRGQGTRKKVLNFLRGLFFGSAENHA